jgi:hypothetical protein
MIINYFWITRVSDYGGRVASIKILLCYIYSDCGGGVAIIKII